MASVHGKISTAQVPPPPDLKVFRPQNAYVALGLAASHLMTKPARRHERNRRARRRRHQHTLGRAAPPAALVAWVSCWRRHVAPPDRDSLTEAEPRREMRGRVGRDAGRIGYERLEYQLRRD
jgi:hypothetical protein